MNKIVFTFQLKEKINDDQEDSQDAFTVSADSMDDQSSVCSDRSRASTTPTCTTRKLIRNSKKSTDDEALISSLEERSEQFLSMQKQLLSQIRPSGDKDRDSFIDWLRTEMHNLEHNLWRRCQRDLSDVMYRYIAENDTLQSRKQSTCIVSEVSPNQPSSSSMSFSHRPTQGWQPAPHFWPSSIQNPTSVWGSMDSTWVQQQFPHYTSQTKDFDKASQKTAAQNLASCSNQNTLKDYDSSAGSTSETPLSSFTRILRDIRESEEQTEPFDRNNSSD